MISGEIDSGMDRGDTAHPVRSDRLIANSKHDARTIRSAQLKPPRLLGVGTLVAQKECGYDMKGLPVAGERHLAV
jgi:hypothetical protein